MNPDTKHKLAGAQIFRQAIEYINENGWDRNSMDILLKVTPGQIWRQPMAVFMFMELGNVLGSETLTKFDTHANHEDVIVLFERVAHNLENSN